MTMGKGTAQRVYRPRAGGSRLTADGFSLTEVLIAIAILVIALVMVGASFPVGVAMTTNVAERTIAAVVADEAFAKIKLYGLRDVSKSVSDVSSAWYTPSFSVTLSEMVRQEWVPFETVAASLPGDRREVFAYPSDTDMIQSGDSVYYWSALCRRELNSAGIPTGEVRIVVFVSRRVGGGNVKYPVYYEREGEAAAPPVPLNDWPRPVLLFNDNNSDTVFNSGDLCVIRRMPGSSARTVRILGKTPSADPGRQRIYLNPGCFVLDDTTGEVYRVVERTTSDFIFLDRDFVEKSLNPQANYKLWVVPTGIGTTRNPCIAVYQKVLKF